MSEPVEIKCCHGIVVVRPGDRLLVAVNDDFDVTEAQKIAADRLDGIELVFIYANSLAVQQGA